MTQAALNPAVVATGGGPQPPVSESKAQRRALPYCPRCKYFCEHCADCQRCCKSMQEQGLGCNVCATNLARAAAATRGNRTSGINGPPGDAERQAWDTFTATQAYRAFQRGGPRAFRILEWKQLGRAGRDAWCRSSKKNNAWRREGSTGVGNAKAPAVGDGGKASSISGGASRNQAPVSSNHVDEARSSTPHERDVEGNITGGIEVCLHFWNMNGAPFHAPMTLRLQPPHVEVRRYRTIFEYIKASSNRGQSLILDEDEPIHEGIKLSTIWRHFPTRSSDETSTVRVLDVTVCGKPKELPPNLTIHEKLRGLKTVAYLNLG